MRLQGKLQEIYRVHRLNYLTVCPMTPILFLQLFIVTCFFFILVDQILRIPYLRLCRQRSKSIVIKKPRWHNALSFLRTCVCACDGL